ncbi:MAG: class I SAM-dependent methyltransferase [Algoriphagus sp.]|nr:class I SAM-dependent methyltransferase [Algoriphagus sp.]
MKDIDNYIRIWFIDLSIEKIPLSFFVIRQSLLKAVDVLKSEIKGKVVDLGCGVMPYKDYLISSNIDKYIGIDIDNSSYHGLIKPDLFWDGYNIPMKDSSCDYVIATEFLEHYYNTEHILLEIKRVLKDGGKLFFTVPSVWPIHEAPFDYHRFTPFCLEEHFKKAEFSCWVIRPLGGLHTSIALVLSFWFEKFSMKNLKFLFKPFFFFIIKLLLKREKPHNLFQNGQFYSGLYGFVTK